MASCPGTIANAACISPLWGGGATGVELSAELFKAREWFATYGLRHIRPEHLRVSLIEAGPRLLPALSERISAAVHRELEKLGVEVRVATLGFTGGKQRPGL